MTHFLSTKSWQPAPPQPACVRLCTLVCTTHLCCVLLSVRVAAAVQPEVYDSLVGVESRPQRSGMLLLSKISPFMTLSGLFSLTLSLNESIHPSIPPGSGCCWSPSQQARGEATPWTGGQLIAGLTYRQKNHSRSF